MPIIIKDTLMATSSNFSSRLTSLSLRLIKAGLLTEDQALTAQLEAQNAKASFIDYLGGSGLVTGDNLASLVAEEFGLPYLDLGAFNIELLPKQVIEDELLVKHQVLPLALKGNHLHLAISSPTNLAAIDEIKFHTGYLVHPLVVAEEKLHKLLNASLETDLTAMTSLESVDLQELDQSNAPLTEELSLHTDQDDAPIVKFVNKVLAEAVRLNASDIHFEPFESTYRIRCRIDGMLHELTRPPLSIRSRLAARIKVMARMNISERRIPQDGSIKLKIGNQRSLDFRVNTLPTLWGEKIVLRILDATSTQLGIDQLGFEPEQQKLYEEALAKPQGMVLVTGPTGSGKTVTLYSGIHLINTPEKNISSVEDPVEINVEGINQVNINPRVGLTFAAALSAFLRQDPDVVMLGEIRDLETAEIAVKAAQTGHLVLSTLHTNSAAATINRLVNMGIPTYNLASSLQLIIAQRLARKLCPSCKQPDTSPQEALLKLGFTEEELSQHTLYAAKGCSNCTAGYKGRVGIYEVVKITPELAEEILREASTHVISDKASEQGFYNLRIAGRKKALAGLISVSELARVTMD